MSVHSTAVALVASQWYWMYVVDGATVALYTVREQELCCGDVRLLQPTQLLALDGEGLLVAVLRSTRYWWSAALQCCCPHSVLRESG